MPDAPHPTPPLTLFSVVIPARDEEASLPPTLRALYMEFLREEIPHEIVVVDDGSKDTTWAVLEILRREIPTLMPVRNPGPHGFGRAIVYGFGQIRGDAVVVKNREGREIARGLAAYNASDAERIAGKRTVEIEAILGYRGRDERIHRDDLTLPGH